MSSVESDRLLKLYERYDNKVLKEKQRFVDYRNSLINELRFDYDYGGFRNDAIKTLINIKPTQFDNIKIITSKLRATQKEIKHTLHNLRTVPIRPKALMPSFDGTEYEMSVIGKDGLKSAQKLMQNFFGNQYKKTEIWGNIEKAIQENGLDAGFAIFNTWYVNGLKEAMDSITHLNELRSVDLGIIHRGWISIYNDYIKTIENASISENGYFCVYREIEGAYNIYKLSADKKLVKYGLNTISANTPHSMIEGFREIGFSGTKWLGKKEFYETFDKFVPYINLDGDNAYFDKELHHVRIDLNGLQNRIKRSEFYRTSLQYHEFGHAKDFLQGNWSQSNEFKSLYYKYYNEYNQKEYYYIKDGEEKWRIEDTYFEVKKRCEESLGNKREKFAKISDSLQALSKSHDWIDEFGHDKSYYKTIESCIAELIAHISEARWGGNDYFKDIVGEFYEEAIKLYNKFLERTSPGKR